MRAALGWVSESDSRGYDPAFAKYAPSIYPPSMSLEELKAEAAKLPKNEKVEFVTWFESQEEIQEWRRAELIQAIDEGIWSAENEPLLKSDEVFGAIYRDLGIKPK